MRPHSCPQVVYMCRHCPRYRKTEGKPGARRTLTRSEHFHQAAVHTAAGTKIRTGESRGVSTCMGRVRRFRRAIPARIQSSGFDLLHAAPYRQKT
jgi:hypothetical protein